MATQAETAKRLGMFQPDVSKWSKRLAVDLESCMKETPLKMLKDRGLTIKIVKVKNKG